MKKVQTDLDLNSGCVVETPVAEIGNDWGLSLNTGEVVTFKPCEAVAPGVKVYLDDYGSTLLGQRKEGFIGQELTAQWEYDGRIREARRRLEDRLRKDRVMLARAYEAVFNHNPIT